MAKRVIAVFSMDEESLQNLENGNIENAFSWCELSGLTLEEYETYDDGELIPDIIKRDSEEH